MKVTDFSKRNLLLRILRAGVKAVLIYIAYFIFMLLTQQVYELIKGYSLFIEGFFVAIAVFTFLIEFFSGTIFKYMLEFSKDLFVIFYLIFGLKGGIISADIQNITVILNIQFFLMMIALISLIRVIKTVLSAINFLHEKSEKELEIGTMAYNVE